MALGIAPVNSTRETLFCEFSRAFVDLSRGLYAMSDRKFCALCCMQIRGKSGRVPENAECVRILPPAAARAAAANLEARVGHLNTAQQEACRSSTYLHNQSGKQCWKLVQSEIDEARLKRQSRQSEYVPKPVVKREVPSGANRAERELTLDDLSFEGSKGVPFVALSPDDAMRGEELAEEERREERSEQMAKRQRSAAGASGAGAAGTSGAADEALELEAAALTQAAELAAAETGGMRAPLVGFAG